MWNVADFDVSGYFIIFIYDYIDIREYNFDTSRDNNDTFALICTKFDDCPVIRGYISELHMATGLYAIAGDAKLNYHMRYQNWIFPYELTYMQFRYFR